MRTKKINRTALMTVFAIVAVIIVTYTNNIVSNAASTVPAAYQCVFDASYYASRYPDLQAAFGNNEAALFNHFVTCGMAEGRQGSAEFDVNFYRATYADLQAAFGDNLPAYYAHYMNNGKAEGRTGAGAAPVANNTPATNTNTQANNDGARVYTFTGTWKPGEKEFYTRILDSILTPGMTDMEVAKAIHDYLCRTYHYAQAGETVTTLNDIYANTVAANYYGFTANPAMANSTAFECDSYAQAYQTLMSVAGIPTVHISGIANGGGHGWNCSYINGQYLYTDVTWDDSRNGIKYDYFMISEAQMNINHTPNHIYGSF